MNDRRTYKPDPAFPILNNVAAPSPALAPGDIQHVGTALSFADHLGSWRARWDIGRLNYRVRPGLYAVGRPSPDAPVLVSANYKMSFDHLRSQLTGRTAWILVLDTRGVNVWCAAGKGTFGTDELVARAASVGLEQVVDHRTLIVPQLGAVGVSAHQVQQRTGFRVVFGPVRAEDLPVFLDAGLKVTPEMQRVRFPMRDRLVLAPVEIVAGFRITLLVALALVALSGLGSGGYEVARLKSTGLISAAIVLGTTLVGAILVPALLPWLPGRAFSVKGAWAGALLVGGLAAYVGPSIGLFGNWAAAVAWLFFIPAVTSFLGMNFTGASTYTSLSGVLKEMRVAVPLQIGAAVLALGLWITGLFLHAG